MDVILCHQTADFDALGAAVGLSRLYWGSRIVLTGGAHPAVRDFLALHRDELALIELRSVNPKRLRSIRVVDSQQRERLGKAQAWLDLPHLENVEVYDHHLGVESDIPARQIQVEAVGATTTLIVEKLQAEQIALAPVEATVMALGIHVDTGSLTFEQSNARDARALAWLMEQGANLRVIAEYADPGFTPPLQFLFTEALQALQSQTVGSYHLGSVLLKTEAFVPGLSHLAERLLELTELDALLLGHYYTKRREEVAYPEGRLTVIGRTRIPGTDLTSLFVPLGGGGHAQAASVNLRGVEPTSLLATLQQQLIEQVPPPLTARDLMSSPVRTIRPHTTIDQAQRVLFRYGHSGLSVVDEQDQLVGIISRRDLDLALHHGFSHAPVKGYMSRNLKIITPDTQLPDIEKLMVTYDIGRLPVVDQGKLVGIVTRTDILRQLHQDRTALQSRLETRESCLLPSVQRALGLLKSLLQPALWQLLEQAALWSQGQGWHLYLVGGGVRDVLLAEEGTHLELQDIDLVVDGFHRAADVGAGVALATELQRAYPQTKLSVHGEFQTAALLWHKDPVLGSLWMDIATARTEFYPYPAANPEVEASSIRQDLYRRDFTINALALRLTPPRQGEVLDFFGGLLDLQARQLRVLHANSFIEDPTRIYRGVRFAVRLGFEFEPETERFIRHALESGVYERLRLGNHPAPALTTRLKAELSVILRSSYWQAALALLSDLGALKCLHPALALTPQLWWQLRYADRWLRYLDPEHSLEHWLVRLALLLATVPESERAMIAGNLQLPKAWVETLGQLASRERQISQELLLCPKPSQIVKLLRPYHLEMVILVAARGNKALRRQLWHYWTRLRQVQALITGEDLKRWGYRPGPLYKQILDQALCATLDNELQDTDQAGQWLQQQSFEN
jgi:tRNA nucleotidyltransferase (CCA-adding enzyme)